MLLFLCYSTLYCCLGGFYFFALEGLKFLKSLEMFKVFVSSRKNLGNSVHVNNKIVILMSVCFKISVVFYMLYYNDSKMRFS